MSCFADLSQDPLTASEVNKFLLKFDPEHKNTLRALEICVNVSHVMHMHEFAAGYAICDLHRQNSMCKMKKQQYMVTDVIISNCYVSGNTYMTVQILSNG